MKRMVLCAATLLALSAGLSYAAIPNTTDFLNRTSPMISGTVFSVDDRQIVVDTDQNQRVTLVMDSRTMLPVDLAPGMVMRAQFRVMENGQYYVSRITPIRDEKVAPGGRASANVHGDALDLARADMARAHMPPAAKTSAVLPEQAVLVAQAPLAERASASEPPVVTELSAANDEPKTLPQTASGHSLLVLLGLLALAGAGTVRLTRRFFRV